MLALARRLLGVEQEARACTYDACLAAARSWNGAGEESECDARAFLRVTARLALERLRARPPQGEEEIRALLPRFRRDGHRAPRGAASRSLAASAALLPILDPRSEVQACIDRLPRRYREALLLCDVERFEERDAAELLALSSARLRSILHGARLALLEMLQREELV
ncbi:MAG: hypothetical protein JNM84_09280 [Planctomycetes bacterium]|nr:hypothetical protein [Planctomycetota bacterium]